MASTFYNPTLQSSGAGKGDLFWKYVQNKEKAAVSEPSQLSQSRLDGLLINIKNFAHNLHLLKMVAEQEPEGRLWHYVELSKVDPRIRYAASNAISALNMLRSLAGKDLSRANLFGANLFSTNCHRTNFTGANLEGVNFKLAYLEKAVFAKAKLLGANFGQSMLRNQNFACRDATCIATQGDLIAIGAKSEEYEEKKSRLHIWTFRGRVINEIPCEYDSGVRSAAFTADGTNLVTCGTDCCVNVWNTENGALLHTFMTNYVLKSVMQEKFSEEVFNKLLAHACIKLVLDRPDFVEISLDREVFEKAQLPDLEGILNLMTEQLGLFDCHVSQSIDEPLIACTKKNGDIFIWNLKSRALVSLITGEEAAGNPVLLADGKHMLFPTKKEVKLLNLESKKIVKTWSSPMPSYHQVCVTSDEQLIAASGFEGVVIWSFDRTDPIKILYHAFALDKDNRSSTDIPDFVQAVTFSNNGQLLAVGFKNEIRVWKTGNWELVQSFGGKELEYGPTDLKFLQDNQSLLSTFSLHDPKIWKISNSAAEHSEMHSYDIQSLQITNDGKFLVSLSAHTLRIWNAQNGGFLWKEELIDAFVLSHDSRYLLLQSKKRVTLWDLETRMQIKSRESQDDIKGIAFLSNGRFAILSEVKVTSYDCINNNLVYSDIRNQMGSLSTHEFSKDGRWFAFGTEDGTIGAWNSEGTTLYKIENTHQSKISRIHCSENCIISKSDSSIHIWRPKEKIKHRFELDGDMHLIPGTQNLFLFRQAASLGVYVLEKDGIKLIHPIRALAQAPLMKYFDRVDPDMVFMKDDFGKSKQWSDNREAIYNASRNDAFFLARECNIAFHPKDPIIAIGGENGMIQLWNPITGRLINILRGHTAAISHIVFSEDGLSLTTASKDRTLQQWDLENGIENILLKWRSQPHSLILHGVNTHNAVLDGTVENLFFDEDAKTDVGLAFEFLLRNEDRYITKPYLFPPDEASYYTNVEVKSANHDRAIELLHNKLLKIQDDKTLVDSFLAYYQELFELIPTGFHFILEALQAIAQGIRDNTLVCQVHPCLLMQILEKETRRPINTRVFLDQKLQALAHRFVQMQFRVTIQDQWKVFAEAGDIFLREKNGARAIICYTHSLNINPDTDNYHKRGLAFLNWNIEEGVKDLRKAEGRCISPSRVKRLEIVDLLEKVTSQKFDPDLLKPLKALGETWKAEKNFVLARRYLEKALEVCDHFYRHIDKSETAKILLILGNTCSSLMDHSNALKYLSRALDLELDINFGKRPCIEIAKIYNGLGMVYYHQKNFDKSSEFLNLALTEATKADDKNGTLTKVIRKNLQILAKNK